MRKLAVSLVILIIAAGVAFYFGWIQLQLPPNSYGVIFTKTNGFEQAVVRPGDFVWRWQRLLPTDLTLYTYRLTPQETRITSTGTLPSGTLYSQFLDGKPSFSFKIVVAVSYVLKPTALPGLMVHDRITPKTLDGWYATLANRLTAATQNYVSSEAGSGDPAQLGITMLQPGLQKHLQQSFPDVHFTSVTPQTFDMPDLALYTKAREQYLSIVSAQQQARQQAAVTKANLDETAAQKIELLRKYGELFNQYPVLLKYLDLAPDKRQNVIPGF